MFPSHDPAGLGTITAGTVTGATVQTDSAASTGIKMTSSSLIGYDANSVETFNLNASTGQFVHRQIPTDVSNNPYFIGSKNDGMTEINAGGTTRFFADTEMSDTTTTGLRTGALVYSDEETWSADMLFSVALEVDATTNQDVFFGFSKANQAVAYGNATTTDRHIAFMIDDGTLYASNADGTTQTTTDISSGITLTNRNAYRIEWDNGTDIKFYVNDSLKATHTTNLPSGGTDVPHVLMALSPTSGSKRWKIGNNYQFRLSI